MAKLTLTDITSGYNSATLQNANNTLIEAALENTLSRDGTSPNAMSAQIDLGSNKLINVAEGTVGTDGINKNQLDAITAALGGDHGALLGLSDDDHLQYLLVDGTRAMTGNLAMVDNNVTRPVIKDYGITHTTPVISTNTITYDLSLGNSFDVSLTSNITTTTLSNPPVAGTYGEIVILLKQDATGGRTVAWPSSVKWAGGTSPTITITANAIDRIVLSTIDGGSTYHGNFTQDSK